MLPLAAHGNTDPRKVEKSPQGRRGLMLRRTSLGVWFGSCQPEERERDRDSAGLGKIGVLEQDS